MERLVDRKKGCTKFWCSLFYGALPALFITIFTENGTIEVLISEKQMSKRRQVV